MSTIKITYYDKMTSLLNELVARDVGLAKESLQVGSAKVASGVRKYMLSMSHNMHYRIIGGKKRMFKGGRRTLGTRTDPLSGDSLNPSNMASQIHFYVPDGGSRTAVVGGAHKTFQPKAYKFGKVVGSYGKRQKAVGSKGRAILHKLNTGEVTSDNPHFGDPFWDKINFAKNRRFFEKGFNSSIHSANKSIEKRYYQSLDNIIVNMPIKATKRVITA